MKIPVLPDSLLPWEDPIFTTLVQHGKEMLSLRHIPSSLRLAAISRVWSAPYRLFSMLAATSYRGG
jgi:hypothetical protein